MLDSVDIKVLQGRATEIFSEIAEKRRTRHMTYAAHTFHVEFFVVIFLQVYDGVHNVIKKAVNANFFIVIVIFFDFFSQKKRQKMQK